MGSSKSNSKKKTLNIGSSSEEVITIRGARQHNLKNVDLSIPRNKLVVFTGVSGSGKSSLAFDTIFAEGQRRYVESLSAYARQFLGQVDKPDVDSIEGLSPAISIDQKSTSHNPRSTVGTVTEIQDYFRLLFGRAGEPHCPECSRPIKPQTIDEMVDQIKTLPEGTRYQLLAPVVRGKKGTHSKLLSGLAAEGFVRVRINKEVRELADNIELDKNQVHSIEVVVDRLIAREGIEERLTDSLSTTLKRGDGLAIVEAVPKKNEEKKAILETYTKEYSAEYQAQALIDIAKKLNKKIQNLSQIKKIDIYTSHHTHYVIGTGANDPQKMDPKASRETLDHSIMYIFAVALEDASWHHVNSYKKSRANKKSTIKIWRSIKTHEDKKWTRKYHDPNPKNKSFGAKVVVTLNNNKKIIEQLDKADAHPYGLRPFVRKNYINKFLTLTKNILSKKESDRFLKTVQNLTKLKSGQLNKLNIEIKSSNLKKNNKKGIF